MSTEGNEHGYRVLRDGDTIDDILTEFEEEDRNDTAFSSEYIDPVIDSFRIGLLYECFIAAIRNGSTSPSAGDYFHPDKPCILAIRCRNNEEKSLFYVTLDGILSGSYRQKYAGNRPKKSQAIDYIVYEDSAKKKTNDGILNVLFEHNRVFIFMAPEQEIPENIRGFISAEIALQCTAEALESAIKKYIDHEFYLDAQIGRELIAVPVAQLMTIFCEGRPPLKSYELAHAWLDAQMSGTEPDNIVTAHDETEPMLDDLYGLGEAGAWGHELATDLADWQAGKISWSEVDRGILLSGAPGTGKTTFASALARSCSIKLIATSMAQWQARGHLGDYLKAMRKAFDDAKKAAPCILFIDEFDSAGDRNSGDSDNRSYDVKAINGLLECLDGVAGREGVVVVGATNDPSRVDPALRRPGRLDTIIEIPLPDDLAREGILRFHLKRDLMDANLSSVVERSEGMAGAWLEALVRQARRTARRQRREMVITDLLNALPARMPMPANILAVLAIHEAGHAIVALENGSEIAEAVVAREFIRGSNEVCGGFVSVRESEAHCLHSQAETYKAIRRALGGLAAEDVFLGERHDGGLDDIRQATYRAARMEMSTGQAAQLTFISNPDVDSILSALKPRLDIQKRVETVLQKCMSEAKNIIERRQDDVKKLADALIEHGRMTGAEITELLAKQPKRIRLLKHMKERSEEFDEYPFYQYA
ncbi:AAA family ATPase [Brucellaceae bacterium D45D]